MATALWVVLVSLFSFSLGDFRCPRDSIDEFHRDPKDCSVFYRCYDGGRQARFSCAPGTAFNLKTNNCDWPHLVKCESYEDRNAPVAGSQRHVYTSKPPSNEDFDDNYEPELDARSERPKNTKGRPKEDNVYGQSKDTNKTPYLPPKWPYSTRERDPYNPVLGHEDNVYGPNKDPNKNPYLPSKSQNLPKEHDPYNPISHHENNVYGQSKDTSKNPYLPSKRPHSPRERDPYGPVSRHEENVYGPNKDPNKNPYLPSKSQNSPNERDPYNPVSGQPSNEYPDYSYRPPPISSASQTKPERGKTRFDESKSRTYEPDDYQQQKIPISKPSFPQQEVDQKQGRNPNQPYPTYPNYQNLPEKPSVPHNQPIRPQISKSDNVPNYIHKPQNSSRGALEPNFGIGRPQEPHNFPTYPPSPSRQPKRQESKDSAQPDLNQLRNLSKTNYDNLYQLCLRLYGQEERSVSPDFQYESRTPMIKHSKLKICEEFNPKHHHSENSPDTFPWGQTPVPPKRQSEPRVDPDRYEPHGRYDSIPKSGSDPRNQDSRFEQRKDELEFDDNYKPQWHKPSYDFNRQGRKNLDTSTRPTEREGTQNSKGSQAGFKPRYDQTSGQRSYPVVSNQYNPSPRIYKPSDTTHRKIDQWPNIQQRREENLYPSSSNIDPRFPEEEEMIDAMNRISDSDPFSVSDLMKNLRCSESLFTDCRNCDKLSWLQFPKVLLKSPASESSYFRPSQVVKECFQRCYNTKCVAYSYNHNSGACLLFMSQVSSDNIIINEEYTTVIKEPKTATLKEEWLYTSPAAPRGNQMAITSTENFIACLQVCNRIGESCKAIGYDSATKSCKLYDAMNGKEIALKSNSVAVQHKSISEVGDKWRFTPYGSRRLNASIPIYSFAISDPQECFQECLKTKSCIFISIEGKYSKECHIYNEISSYTDDINFESFILRVPENSSYFSELPNLFFTGRPVSQYNQIDLKSCQEIARNTKIARKLSYLVDRQECRVFADSAEISRWHNPEIEMKTYIINMPLDETYLPFSRLTGFTLYDPSNPPSLILNDELSVSKCLEKCIRQNCSVVGVAYNVTMQTIECTLIQESQLKMSLRMIYKNNTELFFKTLPSNILASDGLNDICSHSNHRPHAVKNVEDFIKKSSSPHRGHQYESVRSDYIPNHSRNKYDYKMMPAHGDEFIGLPEELPNYRSKRSVYGMTIHGSQVYDLLMHEPNSDTLRAGLQAGLASNDILKATLDHSNKENEIGAKQFLRNFLQSIMAKQMHPVDDDGFLSKMVDAVRRARRVHEEGISERVSCHMTRGSASRQMSCSRNEVCLSSPIIKFSDSEKMSLCENIRINGSCPLSCKSGYKPTVDHVKCEQLGNRGEWNTMHASCAPDSRDCSQLPWIEIKGDEGLIKEKLHYITKFDIFKKLPIFSLYQHKAENALKKVHDPEGHIIPHPCPQLKGHQMSHISYKFSNYSKGFLAPPSALRYSKEAFTASQYLINTAPQDPFSKQVPWKILNERLNNHLDKMGGFVVSGVCLKQIYLPLNPTLTVPKCFWKIVCTKTERGEVTAAAFYHENTHPASAFDKRARIEELMSYTNQDYVKSLIGQTHYDSIWTEALDVFTRNQTRDTKEEMMILQCALAKSITPTVVNFWNDLLTNPSKGPQWPYDFKDGVVSSDEPKLADEQASLRVRSSPECNKKVIASVINSIDKLNQDLIVNSVTHLVYSFINVHSNGSLSFGNNSKNSYSLLYKMISLREKKPELKLIFAIGGWDNSEHFSYIAANPSIQRVFISDLIAFLDYWKFDGIDITWQYPVVGGKKPGFKADRENYVMLLKNIREAFNVHLSTQPELLTDKLSLSITAPGAFWIVEQGYDLNRIIDVVDWVNVLAFDYFGAYKSAWGTYTGPIAPLYFGAPDGFPGKLNVEATMKKYACETRKANKIVMGVPFYGRFWKNVGNPVKNEDDLYRTSQSIGGFPDGGTITYDEIKVKFRKESDEKEIFHEKTQTPYSWNKIKKTLISYENERSIAAKVNYAINHNLGGIFIWSLNFDDSNSSLLNAVSQNFHCQPNFSEYKCSEIKEKRWWTQYDGDGSNDRMCGKLAPLINGFYPICDPDDPGYSCCGTYGFCGSGAEFCECKGCIDYGKMPEKALIEPIKPSQALRWHTLNASLNGSTPKCGPKAPKLIDGQIPICNPDANDSYCCSSSGYCGAGSSYCQCKDCVDFRANPNHVYQQKMWWGWDDGPEVAGRCGLRAPKINGQYPICDPDSRSSYCCGYTGYCGSGRSFCDCPNCVNFKTNPTFRW